MAGMKRKPRPLKVLVADDSAPVRSRLVSMLGELPGVVLAGEAGDVPETIEAIRTLKPDVVLLDLHMPGGSGLDVLRQMAIGQLRAIVIVLTHYALPEYEQAARAAGAHAFFSKSQEFTQAIEMIQSIATNSKTVPPLP